MKQVKQLSLRSMAIAGFLIILSNVANASWTETVIASFNKTDGSLPEGLVSDSKGNLYGATYFGGASGNGTVFRLTPPAADKTSWSETTLVSFDGANGSYPEGGLVLDSKGNLYGTTGRDGAGSQTMARSSD